MYLSLDWLKDFVEIPKNISPDELGSRLTLHTVEIDGVEKQADKFANVVVGKILEVKKHPNAERLQLARVSIGKEELGIVCGAPNIEAGQLVPVACVGAILPNGMEIREALVRGERSVGMLCAEDELGLGSDHAGILILDKNAKVGQSFGEYLGLKDIIFEVDNKSITNRADLWGHFGMAREIAAFLGTKTTKKFDKILESKIETDKEEITINAKVLDKDMCPRYMAVAMDGIKIGPSPEWMQRRLTAATVRPINNIVDITNYVMMELGQPMHAFDATSIDKIIVRRAKKNEVIKTLDGEKRELTENMLVIANAQAPVAVAGVMGGEYSEVRDETTRIVFESANFEHVSLRKTSTKLGLRTESSIRYEKGLDPNLCAMALARAVELVREICPDAKVISKVVDEKNFSLNQGPIDLSVKWLNNFIGADVKKKKIVDILESLGFGVEGKNDDLKVAIPTWRAVKDISIREDLAEEVARIIGYDNLTPVMPMVDMKRPQV
ncbi:MAG: phenylalanine--tRNA ligase subunit beta, partial [Candidatus Magasanikbacteria bacterium]|nr:phenylalanine--tRNA ligase subunit beta [Candidatus Magasanikbacteria bacterium]